jgi:hypothetical protein
MFPYKRFATDALVILFIFLSSASFGQEDKVEFSLDTLSIRTLYDTPMPTFKIKYDTVHVELLMSNRKLAIIPAYLRRHIDSTFISSAIYKMEQLPDKKILLKILLSIESKER